jgi:anti-anti-sigma factor
VIDDEVARETLVSLERAREDERAKRIEAEGVAEALLLFTEPGMVAETLERIIAAFGRVLGASAAFAISFGEDGSGVAIASTDQRFQSTKWQVGATFARALAGRPIASFDVTQVAEWQAQPASVRASVRSALHSPIESGALSALIVLVHPAAFFDKRHVNLARRLTHPAAQALARARTEEAEERLRAELTQKNEELGREIAKRIQAESELGWERESAHRRELAEKLDIIEHQRAAIHALSMPILEVWSGVLCVPVVGVMDEERSRQMASALLDAVSTTRARWVVIDVTGIDRMDATSCEHLLRVANAVRLLGGECALTGIGPNVAKMLVGTGFDGQRITAYRRLQDALQRLLRMQGEALRSPPKSDVEGEGESLGSSRE